MYNEFDDLDYNQDRKHVLNETPFSGIVYEKLPDGGLNEIMINKMYRFQKSLTAFMSLKNNEIHYD